MDKIWVILIAFLGLIIYVGLLKKFFLLLQGLVDAGRKLRPPQPLPAVNADRITGQIYEYVSAEEFVNSAKEKFLQGEEFRIDYFNTNPGGEPLIFFDEVLRLLGRDIPVVMFYEDNRLIVKTLVSSGNSVDMRKTLPNHFDSRVQ